MAQNARTTEDRHAAEAGLAELSVVLVTNQNDPSILNPDFLRYTGIVDKSLNVSQPPISTPVLSYVVFEGDIGVRAEPNRFVFEQRGYPLNKDESVVPQIAGRLVQKLSYINYTAIGINAKSVLLPRYNAQYKIADALIDSGKWLSFRDMEPDVHLKTIYNFENRKIVLEVGSADIMRNDSTTGQDLLFQANIHRDIGGETQDQRIEKITAILHGWKNDISDFNNLVTKFLPTEPLR